MVPFRPVFEKLGLKVEWDESAQTVRGFKDGVEISLQVGKQAASIGKRNIGLTVAPKVINGTTYVPLRFVGEALNLQVEWDDVNREVRIGSSDQMAKQVVTRFLEHLEQGDDYRATADLVNSNQSIVVRAPVLAPFFKQKQWMSEVKSMTVQQRDEESFMVKTTQRNQSFDRNEILDNVDNNWYLIKRLPNGRWKLEDSDLFQRKTIFN